MPSWETLCRGNLKQRGLEMKRGDLESRVAPFLLPPDCREKLRQMAAKRNLQNPQRVTSAVTNARELVLEGIEKIERMEAMFMASNAKEDGQRQSQVQEFIPTTAV